MHTETDFELISTGEIAADSSSAKDAGLTLLPSGPLAADAFETAADSVTGTFDTSAPRTASR